MLLAGVCGLCGFYVDSVLVPSQGYKAGHRGLRSLLHPSQWCGDPYIGQTYIPFPAWQPANPLSLWESLDCHHLSAMSVLPCLDARSQKLLLYILSLLVICGHSEDIRMILATLSELSVKSFGHLISMFSYLRAISSGPKVSEDRGPRLTSFLCE